MPGEAAREWVDAFEPPKRQGTYLQLRASQVCEILGGCLSRALSVVTSSADDDDVMRGSLAVETLCALLVEHPIVYVGVPAVSLQATTTTEAASLSQYPVQQDEHSAESDDAAVQPLCRTALQRALSYILLEQQQPRQDENITQREGEGSLPCTSSSLLASMCYRPKYNVEKMQYYFVHVQDKKKKSWSLDADKGKTDPLLLLVRSVNSKRDTREEDEGKKGASELSCSAPLITILPTTNEEPQPNGTAGDLRNHHNITTKPSGGGTESLHMTRRDSLDSMFTPMDGSGSYLSPRSGQQRPAGSLTTAASKNNMLLASSLSLSDVPVWWKRSLGVLQSEFVMQRERLAAEELFERYVHLSRIRRQDQQSCLVRAACRLVADESQCRDEVVFSESLESLTLMDDIRHDRRVYVVAAQQQRERLEEIRVMLDIVRHQEVEAREEISHIEDKESRRYAVLFHSINFLPNDCWKDVAQGMLNCKAELAACAAAQISVYQDMIRSTVWGVPTMRFDGRERTRHSQHEWGDVADSNQKRMSNISNNASMMTAGRVQEEEDDDALNGGRRDRIEAWKREGKLFEDALSLIERQQAELRDSMVMAVQNTTPSKQSLTASRHTALQATTGLSRAVVVGSGHDRATPSFSSSPYGKLPQHISTSSGRIQRECDAMSLVTGAGAGAASSFSQRADKKPDKEPLGSRLAAVYAHATSDLPNAYIYPPPPSSSKSSVASSSVRSHHNSNNKLGSLTSGLLQKPDAVAHGLISDCRSTNSAGSAHGSASSHTAAASTTKELTPWSTTAVPQNTLRLGNTSEHHLRRQHSSQLTPPLASNNTSVCSLPSIGDEVHDGEEIDHDEDTPPPSPSPGASPLPVAWCPSPHPISVINAFQSKDASLWDFSLSSGVSFSEDSRRATCRVHPGAVTTQTPVVALAVGSSTCRIRMGESVSRTLRVAASPAAGAVSSPRAALTSLPRCGFVISEISPEGENSHPPHVLILGARSIPSSSSLGGYREPNDKWRDATTCVFLSLYTFRGGASSSSYSSSHLDVQGLIKSLMGVLDSQGSSDGPEWMRREHQEVPLTWSSNHAHSNAEGSRAVMSSEATFGVCFTSRSHHSLDVMLNASYSQPQAAARTREHPRLSSSSTTAAGSSVLHIDLHGASDKETCQSSYFGLVPFVWFSHEMQVGELVVS